MENPPGAPAVHPSAVVVHVGTGLTEPTLTSRFPCSDARIKDVVPTVAPCSCWHRPQEQTHHLQVSAIRRKHEGRGATKSRHVRVGAGLTEQTHSLQVSTLRRKREGRGAMRSCLARVGAGLTEQTHHRQASALRCNDEDRGAIRCCLVLVGTGPTNRADTQPQGVRAQTQASRPWRHTVTSCPCGRRPHRADV
jgi:hypothetical protein